ncbi:ABC transporter substrate-binding protein [Streptomyces sp. NPDC045431]|uniref:ABC transporter substrate-binding protein n=1 Tax=Streptomyces sp. NPDC045431 TaxID=3155613 RepID=UPI0033D90AD9
MSAEITFALDSMPLSVDFSWPVDYDGRLIGEALVRTLLTEGAVGSGAAHSPRAYDDGRRWRVTLDTSLTWSDGVPLEASHAERAVRRIARKPGSWLASLLSKKEGEEPVTVVDRETVEYRFEHPTSFADGFFTLPQLAPLRPGSGKLNGPSLGDFTFTSALPDRIVLSRRRDRSERWPQGPGKLGFQHYPSLQKALDAYAEGLVDISSATSFGIPEATRFAGHPNLLKRNISIFGSIEFGDRVNAVTGAVRRVVGAAVDRDRIVDGCAGLVAPYWSQTAPWCDAYELPADLAAASHAPTRREVEDVRRVLGETVDFAYADFSPNQTVVGLVREQLRETFGIDAVLRPLSYQDYVKAVIKRDYGLLYTLTAAEFPHPAALLATWRSDRPAAVHSGFADPVLDRLIDEASVQTDPLRAPRFWQDADRRWLDRMPRVPLVQVRAHCVHSQRVTRLSLNSTGLVDFSGLALSSQSTDLTATERYST